MFWSVSSTAEGQPCGWRLIEVKSSTKVKDVHLEDLAVQSEVILGAGLTLVSVCLMHINTGYLYRDGAIDLTELFAIQDLSEAVAQRRAAVPERLATMNRMLLQTQPPAIEPDRHCHTPYDCPFWEHCTKDKPARWIHYLPGSKQVVDQLTQQGVTTIDEIPAGTKLSPVQRRVKENVEWVSAKLGPVLKAVQYPVHHLDFETVMLAVPRFSETRPYQALPVQWSNHIEQATGELRHEEFLHKDVSDPRKVLAEALLESLGERGSICVYSPYERSILEQLAAALPSLKPALRASLSASGISSRSCETITTILRSAGPIPSSRCCRPWSPRLPMMIWRSKREAMPPVSTTAWSSSKRIGLSGRKSKRRCCPTVSATPCDG